jgi:hypothetical protein
MQSEAIEAVGADGFRLRVEFTWRGDRFGHVISLIHADSTSQPLLESVEGTTNDDWPPSPPLQSLSIETLQGGRRVALLVGMAGGSHWSASIEQAPGERGLIFDLACRHSKKPTWLGSRYQRLDDGAKKLQLEGKDGSVTENGDEVAIQPAKTASTTTRWKYVVRQASTDY